MTISETLGWGTSILASFGLIDIIKAGLLITIAAGLLWTLIGRGKD